jgi:hypothetical protein
MFEALSLYYLGNNLANSLLVSNRRRGRQAQAWALELASAWALEQAQAWAWEQASAWAQAWAQAWVQAWAWRRV